MADFASDHGLPEERFYNLLCLAFGADPVEFADAEDYLPTTRSPNCEFEYRTLVNAFHKEISPYRSGNGTSCVRYKLASGPKVEARESEIMRCKPFHLAFSVSSGPFVLHCTSPVVALCHE
jgi:hypothetical protein